MSASDWGREGRTCEVESMHDGNQSKRTVWYWTACVCVEIAHIRMLPVCRIWGGATVCVCLQRNASNGSDGHVREQGPLR